MLARLEFFKFLHIVAAWVLLQLATTGDAEADNALILQLGADDENGHTRDIVAAKLRKTFADVADLEWQRALDYLQAPSAAVPGAIPGSSTALTVLPQHGEARNTKRRGMNEEYGSVIDSEGPWSALAGRRILRRKVADIGTPQAADQPVGVPRHANPPSTSTGACPPACWLHGTCDESRGICVCPLGRNGSDCSQLSTPSCELFPGYVLPCTDSVPRPCACVTECERELGLLGKHPDAFMCIDTRALARVPGEDEDRALARVYDSPQVTRTSRRVDQQPPRRQQPLTGHEESWEEYVPGAVLSYHPATNRATFVPLSHCPSHCSHAGYCKPVGGRANSGSATHVYGTCRCFHGFEGPACATRASWCPNSCNGPKHGACESGFCRCLPGYFGVDCSLRLPAYAHATGPGAPARDDVHAAIEGTNTGSQEDMDETNNAGSNSHAGRPSGHQLLPGSPRLPLLLWEPDADATAVGMHPGGHPQPKQSGRTTRGHASPTFYVYELPPRFNTWQAQFAGVAEPLDFGRFLGILWMERLLGSRHRVSDPLAADYFFLPIIGRDAYCSRYEAIYWVARNRGEVWDRAVASGVPRHVVVLLHDEGLPAYWPPTVQREGETHSDSHSGHPPDPDSAFSLLASSSWSFPPPTAAAIGAIRKQLVVLQHMGHSRATRAAPLRWWFETPAFAPGADVLIPPEQPGLAQIAEYSPYFGRAVPQGGGYVYRPWGEVAYPSSGSPEGNEDRQAIAGAGWGGPADGQWGQAGSGMAWIASTDDVTLRHHRPAWARPLKLFFSGKAYPVGKRAGDRNVRTRLFQLFFPDGGDSRTHPDALPPGFILINSSVVEDPGYWDHFGTSVFCLSLPGVGGGWGRRGSMALLMGCIPLIIEDERAQPFEELLPWERFSLSVPFDSMHRLPEIVEDALGRPERIADMQREIACLAPLLHWSDLLGALPGASWEMAVAAAAARGAAGGNDPSWPGGPGFPGSSSARMKGGGSFRGEPHAQHGQEQHVSGRGDGRVEGMDIGPHDAFSMTMELLRRRLRRLPKVRSVCELTRWAKGWVEGGDGRSSEGKGADGGDDGASPDGDKGSTPGGRTRATQSREQEHTPGASPPCLWYRLAELGLHGGQPRNQVCRRRGKQIWPPGTAACNERLPPC